MLKHKIIVCSNTYFQETRNSFHEDEISQQNEITIAYLRETEKERETNVKILPVKFFPVTTKNTGDNDMLRNRH